MAKISTIIKVAIILAFFETILKPIIKLLLLPINILTLGGIRLVINTFGLYLAVFVLASFSVQNISTDNTTLLGFDIPPLQFSGFFAYLVSSFTINFLLGLSYLNFITKKEKREKHFIYYPNHSLPLVDCFGFLQANNSPDNKSNFISDTNVEKRGWEK